jgi:hypothetical protein
MADEITVNALNGAAFASAIGEMHDGLADLRGPLESAARELVAAGAGAAPKATGRLAGSHRALPAGPKTVRVMADTDYATVIHWGWPGHGISRRPWLVATWLRNPAPLDKIGAGIQKNIDNAAART